MTSNYPLLPAFTIANIQFHTITIHLIAEDVSEIRTTTPPFTNSPFPTLLYVQRNKKIIDELGQYIRSGQKRTSYSILSWPRQPTAMPCQCVPIVARVRRVVNN